WPAILDLANRSIEQMPDAPRQDEWMKNRRSFVASDGSQEHFVASVVERIVGYAAIERRNNAPAGIYRLFVVVEPSNRANFGTILFAELRKRLLRLGAHSAWMMEFEADAGFIAYLEGMGFRRTKPVVIDGRVAVEMTIDAPFGSISGPR
ncbi:MAG TPA: GNAT family N-acetyltransferase, partial [Candidatus Binataceae bacterium]|nr:GNAT family N-acetyltransferase [Candidatus Binataceae bacterium]